MVTLMSCVDLTIRFVDYRYNHAKKIFDFLNKQLIKNIDSQLREVREMEITNNRSNIHNIHNTSEPKGNIYPSKSLIM